MNKAHIVLGSSGKEELLQALDTTFAQLRRLVTQMQLDGPGWTSPKWPSMPAGMELPETVVFTFTHIPETAFSDLANQIHGQGLVVGNLKSAMGRLVLFQFLAKSLQPRPPLARS